MIIKDKAQTLAKADALSSQIVRLIAEESKAYAPDDDPAEQIYLACHTLGALQAKILLSLDSYGKIYAIEKLDIKTLQKWIKVITDENLKLQHKD